MQASVVVAGCVPFTTTSVAFRFAPKTSYAILIYFCVSANSPVEMSGPIEPIWIELRDAYVGKDEREILKQSLAQYLQAIGLNEDPIQERKRKVIIASYLLPFIVALMLSLSLIPRG